MTPTFLGLGPPRSGTTWLHKLLASHPDVYMCTARKEIHYFDRHFERGLQWYEGFFPPKEQASQYLALGELSPEYLYCTECPERMTSIPTVRRLVITLRNPVERAYSGYGFWVRSENYSGSFREFMSFRPVAIERGFYSQHIGRYLEYFRRDQILILLFEKMVADVAGTKASLASFLDIPANRFPPDAGTRVVNPSYIPRFRFVLSVLGNTARQLRHWDMDWLVNLVRRAGLTRQIFGTAGTMPPMEQEDRNYLEELYNDDINELEALLQMDLGWSS